MIAYLSGKIKYLHPSWLILDVNGVGYKIQLKVESLKLKVGDKIELYIYHHIREDRSELYGFETMDELQAFELLLEVPGVGPKMGMNIMAKTGLEELKNAIVKGDLNFFLSISGVGRKLASKILLELKNKLGSTDFDVTKDTEISTELMDAMQSLGYKKAEIYPQIRKIPPEIKDTDKKIRWILQNSGKK